MNTFPPKSILRIVKIWSLLRQTSVFCNDLRFDSFKSGKARKKGIVKRYETASVTGLAQIGLGRQ